jgi:hypothetical protein
VAFPHSKIDGTLQVVPFQNLDNVGPAGAINSSAAEMSRWLLLQLNHGKFADRDDRLFSEKQSKEMWAGQTILPIGTPPAALASLKANFAAYALGWGTRDYKGRKMVGHTGGVLGYVSRVMLVPEENLGVVILTNAESGSAFDSILFHIIDQYFGVAPTDWIAAFKANDELDRKQADETLAKVGAARNAESKTSLPLEKYVGVYHDAWYGAATIRMESSGLTLTFDHTPGMIGDLQHWQYDTFKSHWRNRQIEDAFVTFALNSDGSISNMKMEAVSPLADFSFDYQDLLFTPKSPAEK